MAGAIPLEDLIQWHFTVGEQDFMSRYGTYAGRFWKQFLPGGLPMPELHPPKLITQQAYELAERQGKRIG